MGIFDKLLRAGENRKVRALDADTGKVLWEADAGAAVEGMPAIYEVGGREYVVFCASAAPSPPNAGGKINGVYVAFALSE